MRILFKGGHYLDFVLLSEPTLLSVLATYQQAGHDSHMFVSALDNRLGRSVLAAQYHYVIAAAAALQLDRFEVAAPHHQQAGHYGFVVDQ